MGFQALIRPAGLARFFLLDQAKTGGVKSLAHLPGQLGRLRFHDKESDGTRHRKAPPGDGDGGNGNRVSEPRPGPTAAR